MYSTMLLMISESEFIMQSSLLLLKFMPEFKLTRRSGNYNRQQAIGKENLLVLEFYDQFMPSIMLELLLIKLEVTE